MYCDENGTCPMAVLKSFLKICCMPYMYMYIIGIERYAEPVNQTSLHLCKGNAGWQAVPFQNYSHVAFWTELPHAHEELDTEAVDILSKKDPKFAGLNAVSSK